ncbi:Dual specificity mitogen-activated protein kinase kinase 3 [Dermatophagoides pteronyssinus]|uniref:mitogen-activated protein kinase kinase n=1 Tax=Dermatophagoides pteronyssinus TaxID=6956 RepID=A0ABQ8IRW5_DERPT|nr:Dual specificity mitogen-activated protein kinase kinase 3 [Dermatophagoides pteronyssinus]
MPKVNRKFPNMNLILPSDDPPLVQQGLPPPNLNRSTKIRINGTTIEIDPENTKPVKQLGHGAYGFVELIEHEPSGIQLAVKRICASKVSDQDRLFRDMDILVKSQGCPHIVEFYGAIYWENNLCLFMEILDASLDKFYKLAYKLLPENSPNNLAIPEPVLGRIAYSVVSALNFLYDMKIIHRDVKPSNILINRSGQIKLCDFGISGYLVDSVAKTFEAGCKAYMAPERLVPNQKGYNIRSDVWSLGLTLLEIATGKFPYPTNDLFKQIKSVYEDDPPKLPEGKYSQEFHYLIGECLKKEHQERPNYEQLLEMDFLKTYQNHDISDFTKFVLDSELVELSSPTTTTPPPVIDKNSLNKSETITNDTDNQLNNMTITNDDNNDDS